MRGDSGASQLDKKLAEYSQELAWAIQAFQVCKTSQLFLLIALMCCTPQAPSRATSCATSRVPSRAPSRLSSHPPSCAQTPILARKSQLP